MCQSMVDLARCYRNGTFYTYTWNTCCRIILSNLVLNTHSNSKQYKMPQQCYIPILDWVCTSTSWFNNLPNTQNTSHCCYFLIDQQSPISLPYWLTPTYILSSCGTFVAPYLLIKFLFVAMFAMLSLLILFILFIYLFNSSIHINNSNIKNTWLFTIVWIKWPTQSHATHVWP